MTGDRAPGPALRLLALAAPVLLSGCGPAILAVAAAVGVSLSDDDDGCSIGGQEVEVTIAGRVRYQKRPEDPRVGSTTLVPVRRATVQVLRLNCGEEVIGTTRTDEDGDYQLTVRTPSASVLRVAALTEITRSNSPVEVRNNSAERLIYSLESDDLLLDEEPAQSFDGQDLDALIDCTAQLAGAFNVLEQSLRGFEALEGAFPDPDSPLVVLWELGNPEGTFFSVSSSDLNGDGRGNDPFIQLRGGAFIPGCRNTDQFDDGIVLHEFGHYVAFLNSRDDSPGGPHSLGEQLDPRLSWSEGWANFYSGLARLNPLIVDTLEDVDDCSGSCALFDFDLEDPNCSPDLCCSGVGNEDAVGAFLWDLFDSTVEAGDGVQLPRAKIFQALEALKDRRFVYVGDYLEEVEPLAAAEIPPQDASVILLAQAEELADGSGQPPPFPFDPDSFTVNGNQAVAVADGNLDACSSDPCKQNVESFIGSSDFYELRLPGSGSNRSGGVQARLQISGGTVSCGRNLDLRIFNEEQSFFYTTEGQTGPSRSISFGFDDEFPRGSWLLVEVTGESGNGQRGSYEVTIDVSP